MSLISTVSAIFSLAHGPAVRLEDATIWQLQSPHSPTWFAVEVWDVAKGYVNLGYAIRGLYLLDHEKEETQ